MHELPFRQIHLDFHTSPQIPGVGSEFNAAAFAATLADAHVNSINLFARCHHGHVYFNTKHFPERRHPALSCNLLPEQIAACHARGIKTPIYITVQWDYFTAQQHPEWLVVDEKGAPRGTPYYEAGFYQSLCLNTPYAAWLQSFVREVIESMPVDGLWFDIVWPQDCSCRWCRQGMIAAGQDPSDGVQRRRYGVEVLERFCLGMTAFVRQHHPDCLVFYNRGHIGPLVRPMLDAFTHLELESLPSGGWGYLHFPATQRYARTLGQQTIGMNGKFHTAWGDFHSYKNQAALEFECFQMLALGAKACIGDQLPPRGTLCPATYDLIGKVFAQIEAKEPFCTATTPVVEIGVLTSEELQKDGGAFSSVPDGVFGAVRMLQEGRQQFDILDSASDFSAYRLLVLPDEMTVDAPLAAKLEAYVAKGGSLIASHRSGLNREKTAFALPALGVDLVGDAPYSPDFIVPRGAIGAGLPEIEHVMYLKGLQVAPRAGTEVLAEVKVPYFNRTWQHFCSHAHTPSSGQVGYPGVLRHGRCVYFMHPLFGQYNKNAPRWCKTLFLNAVHLLLGEPLLRASGPSALLTALNAQAAEQRWVLHLLHYVPERRCKDFDVIEDITPLYEVAVSIRVTRPVRAVTCQPQRQELPFVSEGGRVAFTLPKLAGHQLVVLSFA